MNRKNVVPFQRSVRTAMARRGAPDKHQTLLPDTFEIECPRCSAIASLPMGLLAQAASVLCAECGWVLPILPSGRADLG